MKPAVVLKDAIDEWSLWQQCPRSLNRSLNPSELLLYVWRTLLYGRHLASDVKPLRDTGIYLEVSLLQTAAERLLYYFTFISHHTHITSEDTMTWKSCCLKHSNLFKLHFWVSALSLSFLFVFISVVFSLIFCASSSIFCYLHLSSLPSPVFFLLHLKRSLWKSLSSWKLCLNN